MSKMYYAHFYYTMKGKLGMAKPFCQTKPPLSSNIGDPHRRSRYPRQQIFRAQSDMAKGGSPKISLVVEKIGEMPCRQSHPGGSSSIFLWFFLGIFHENSEIFRKFRGFFRLIEFNIVHH